MRLRRRSTFIAMETSLPVPMVMDEEQYMYELDQYFRSGSAPSRVPSWLIPRVVAVESYMRALNQHCSSCSDAEWESQFEELVQVRNRSRDLIALVRERSCTNYQHLCDHPEYRWFVLHAHRASRALGEAFWEELPPIVWEGPGSAPSFILVQASGRVWAYY